MGFGYTILGFGSGVPAGGEGGLPYDGAGDRAIKSGGTVDRVTIDYWSISTLGNAIDFGDMSSPRENTAGCSDGSRACWGGGYPSGSDIEYNTIGSPGNSIDFGSLSVNRQTNATSDGSRGVFYMGIPGLDTIDYITIGSPGNAIDFGDGTVPRYGGPCTADSTRAIAMGGYAPPLGPIYHQDTIDYITIATPGNAIDFGDLTLGRSGGAATTNGRRGLASGGGANSLGVPRADTLDYVTIQTLGDAIDFGNLSTGRYNHAATSDGSRGVFAGGRPPDPQTNIIEYVELDTLGDALDFGDLTVANHYVQATSGD